LDKRQKQTIKFPHDIVYTWILELDMSSKIRQLPISRAHLTCWNILDVVMSGTWYTCEFYKRRMR